MIVPEADKNLIGVYKIESPSGKTYVGMTCDSFAGRISGHIKYLKNGGHHCKGLQRAYVKYGLENLKFTVLEKWPPINPNETKSLILLAETFWWDKFTSEKIGLYNGRPINGSVSHTEQSRSKISESLRKNSRAQEFLNICESNYSKILEWRSSGFSNSTISKMLNISHASLLRFIRDNEIRFESVVYKPVKYELESYIRNAASDPNVSVRQAAEIVDRSRQWVSQYCKRNDITWTAKRVARNNS